MRWLLILVFCISAVAAEARDKSGLHSFKGWQSKHFTGHPLVGQLFSSDGSKLALNDIKSLLQQADHLLIGEVHDNPDHHRWQAILLGAFSAVRTSKPAVIFEMVPERFQPVLNAARFEDIDENGNLGKQLEWEKRGWPSWRAYSIIFAVALEHELPLRAGSLDRANLRALSNEGLQALPAKERQRYGLQADFPTRLNDDLASELKASHCDLLPDASIPKMIDIQRLRDGVMADAMISASSGDGTVLIAGNGHVRKDRGVPLILRARDPEAKILTIGQVEVSPDAQSFADYAITNPQGEPLYDLVIFTPKFSLTDHCAEMRKAFSKKDDKTKQD